MTCTERFRSEDMPEAYRQAKNAGLFEPIAIDSPPLPLTPASVVASRLSEIQKLQLAIWNEMVLTPNKNILPAKLPVQERPGRFEEYTSKVLVPKGFACLDDLRDWILDTNFPLNIRPGSREVFSWIQDVESMLTAVDLMWDALTKLYSGTIILELRSHQGRKSFIHDQFMLRGKRLTKMAPLVYGIDVMNPLEEFFNRLVDLRFEFDSPPKYDWRICIEGKSIIKVDSAGNVML